MELMEIMQKRRSVRCFKPDKLTQEQIDALLAAAMSGPSACNATPWEFYVATGGEALSRLRTITPYADYESPLIIVVAGNLKRALRGTAQEFWVQDCSAAIENILLCAAAMGLGSCWCGLYPHAAAVKRAQKRLGVEAYIVPLGLVHIGWPAEETEPRTQFDAARVHTVE